MAVINIFLAGDSTVCNYDSSVAPRMGWGQVLGDYMKGNISIHNHAQSGRSSKSFIDEGRLDNISKDIQKGDYFFIQFGHNDAKDDPERHTNPFTSFKYYLTKYIELAEKKEAYPVLITPVQRRSFDENKIFIETHQEYPLAIKQLAQHRGIPLIDLTTHTRNLYESLGPEKSKDLFLWFQPGEHKNYPDGCQDDSHFSEYGANKVAQLVIKEIENLKLPLTKYIKN